MTESKQYQANPVVSCRDEGQDGALLFNPDTDDFLLINPTGKAIWEFIGTRHTSEEMVTFLLETFDVPDEGQATDDVAGFIQELVPDFVQEVE